MIDGYLLILLISMLPWIELRGAIPVGILLLGLDPLPVFGISVLANIAVVVPILLLLDWAYSQLGRYSFVSRCVGGVRNKADKKIEKYGFWGLAAFVAIPLPITGAWTGSLISWLLGLEKKRSLLAISLGIIIAGLIVTLLSLFAVEVLYALGAPRANPL